MNRRFFQVVGPAVSIGLFVLAIGLIHHELRGYRPHDIVHQLRQVGGRDLLAACLLTILNYVVLTANDALALRYARHPLPYHKLAFASFVGYAFSNSATVVGGSAARYRIYSALGLSAGEIAELVTFCGLTVWLGFFLVAGTAFVLHPGSIPIPDILHLPIPSVGLAGAVFLAVVVAYLVGVGLRRRPFVVRGWQVRIPSPKLSAGQILVTATDWLVAAAVLYALLPDPVRVTYPRFLGVFMLGQGAGMVSHVPGGLGVFETVVLLTLGDGAATPALTAALLLYRLIYYIGPLLLGALLLAIHEVLPQMALVRRVGLHLGKWGSALAPQVFASAVFVAGTILLFSGALPPARGRLEILRDLLPLPALELSHFLGSLTGAALLILARGLQRRLDGAYHLTVLLLAAGIGFSLLKGLDYEEAMILALMLAALLPCRREFYRRASLIDQRFSPGWTTFIIIALLCSIWLGFFAYKHVEYSNDLWWRFTFRGHAPRFLRATAGSIALILFYATGRLLLPARPRPEFVPIDTMGRIREIAKASPRTYAHLALLGDKQFLLSEDGRAFLMYGVENRSWVALGDPVGPNDTLASASGPGPQDHGPQASHSTDVPPRDQDPGPARPGLGEQDASTSSMGILPVYRDHVQDARATNTGGPAMVQDQAHPEHSEHDARAVCEDLIWDFVELCDRYHGQPAFYQIDAQSLDLYTNLGLTFLKIGEEARVPLASFSLDGAAKKGLRHSYNKLTRHHYAFRIAPTAEVPALLDRLRYISDTWLREKNTREKGFSLGFFDPAYLVQNPVALVEGPEGIAAFANLWPGAGREELSVDLMRFLPSCPEGIMDYLFIELMFWGRQEGYRWFNLGMAPLAGLPDRTLAPFWSKAGALVFRHGEHFYNFQGLRRYKGKFDPEWRPKYLACRGGLALPRVLTNIASLISGGLGGIVRK